MAACCGGSKDAERKTAVRDAYAAIATTGTRSCCGGKPDGAFSAGIGYDAAELAAVPADADLGLGCGNPAALAALAPGETVLDLGSGGGIDVFLAARRVGPTGRAIGVDMTPAMLDRARRNAETFRERTGLANVEFRLGEIEHLPLADASVDVVISNCVINLSPDKAAVWAEIARVLKPGGRAAVSDLALLAPLPEAVRASASAVIACVGGAEPVEAVRRRAETAGLADVTVAHAPYPAEAFRDFDAALADELARALPPGRTFGDYVVSARVTARRPRG